MHLRSSLSPTRQSLCLTLLLAAAPVFAWTESGEEPQETVAAQGEEETREERAPKTEQPTANGESTENKPVPKAENLELDQPLEEVAQTPADTTAETETAEKPDIAEGQPIPRAENLELDQPVMEDKEAQPEKPTADAGTDTEKGKQEEPAPETRKPLRLLGAEVPPATSTRLAWSPSQHFEGVYSPTAVLVVNGAQPGPTLCMTAAIHGDELNGIETVRRVMYNLDKDKLHGAVIGVPIVNLQGFHRGSRYLTDRRDLNRHFPGHPEGSSASRIAYSFFNEVIEHCNAVVDLHTGSFYRTNLPQLRADLHDPKVVKLTKGFGSTVVLHSDGAEGTLRRAAVEAGIPTVTLEAGAPMVLDERSVSHSVKGIRTLLNQLDMVSKFRLWGDPEPVYYNSTWQRATTGGIIFSEVELGESVREGDLLGTITNPITNVRKEIRSEHDGRVLGMAMNQVVQPGFAAYHIGIRAPQEQISPPAEVTAESEPEDKPQQPQPGEDGDDTEPESTAPEAPPTDEGPPDVEAHDADSDDE
ncbi:succinylglutamate desuccinylase/aspartoacylase family protein [Microbulbifer halophilus]|uniref:Succinylglutamate desuccinylase/aspartoacylase family protein n=1 Tax=Microbulbifer halophilus TaxID=453963 RepID=A0ABW5ECZ4_9GAMM|nr:M14 family metallopeptidase [Microbulbifer halophilus]MCW8125605.1 succinylglutamate desuccinylase/aspartoacylase family protein [Microbulbifer halophilus]